MTTMLGVRLCLLPPIVVAAACTPLTQMQDTAAKFDQGVHVAAVAETNLLHQVQAAECARNFYKQGFDFATASPDAKHKFSKEQSELDLDPTHCVPLELTNEELELRVKLIDLIALYADSLQALTNGTSEKTLARTHRVSPRPSRKWASNRNLRPPLQQTPPRLMRRWS